VRAYFEVVATFVLVHGAWHGAWCWDRLAPELGARGHTVISPDLPFDDGTATFEDCAAVVVSAMADVPGDAVLVGHSLGGMVLPVVAARRPVGLITFLCAVIPNPNGMPWDDLGPMGDDDYGTVTEEDGALVFHSEAAATRIFYADCAPEDAAWAFANLRPLRNQSLWDRPYPLTAWPAVPCAAIACMDDRACYASYQRSALQAQLGIDPVELPGGHSPFLSQPARLADELSGLGGLGHRKA
jgi:pimeloyl-ACP methyl ester carboxylesterase